jgi:hypothetical protein
MPLSQYPHFLYQKIHPNFSKNSLIVSLGTSRTSTFELLREPLNRLKNLNQREEPINNGHPRRPQRLFSKKVTFFRSLNAESNDAASYPAKLE